MTEKQGFNTAFSLLCILSAWCLYMFITSNFDGFRDVNSIYVLINLSVYWKFFFGLKRYENLAEKDILKRSGLRILQYTFIRFY
jgi:hypothetical protein